MTAEVSDVIRGAIMFLGGLSFALSIGVGAYMTWLRFKSYDRHTSRRHLPHFLTGNLARSLLSALVLFELGKRFDEPIGLWEAVALTAFALAIYTNHHLFVDAETPT